MPSSSQLPYIEKKNLCNLFQLLSSRQAPLFQYSHLGGDNQKYEFGRHDLAPVCAFLKVLSLNWIYDSRELLNRTKETTVITLRSCLQHCNVERGLLASGTLEKKLFQIDPSLQHYCLAMLFSPALGLAGMKLIFLIAAHTVLCFRSLTETVLITHSVSAIAEQCLHSTKGFSLSVSDPPPKPVVAGQKAGRECSWDRSKLTTEILHIT